MWQILIILTSITLLGTKVAAETSSGWTNLICVGTKWTDREGKTGVPDFEFIVEFDPDIIESDFKKKDHSVYSEGFCGIKNLRGFKVPDKQESKVTEHKIKINCRGQADNGAQWLTKSQISRNTGDFIMESYFMGMADGTSPGPSGLETTWNGYCKTLKQKF